MGLRTLAYYFERPEAVVVQSMLLDAGLLAIIGNEDMLRMQPYYTLAFGGYRVLVSEHDVGEAIAVLQESLANPVLDGETLIVHGNLMDRIASLAYGWLSGGVPTPIREYIWRNA